MAFALLLSASGALKLWKPKYTRGALRAAGLPSAKALVVTLGLAEIVVGLAVVTTGHALSALAMALLYASFALFVTHALRQGVPVASCGCFGRPDTPPSWIHVVVNVIGFGLGVAASLSPLGPWAGLGDQPISVTLPFITFTLVSVYLLYGVLAVLPHNRAAVRKTPVLLSQTRTR